MNTGEHIKKYRLKLGMTRNELAAKVGVSSSAIALWESNQRIIASDSLYKISRVFGISSDILLTPDEEVKEQIFNRKLRENMIDSFIFNMYHDGKLSSKDGLDNLSKTDKKQLMDTINCYIRTILVEKEKNISK